MRHTARLWALVAVLIPLGVNGIAPVARAQETAAPAAAEEGAADETAGVASIEGLEAASDDERRTLREWYQFGGWVMHLIVAVSMLAFAVVLERAWSLRRGRIIPGKFLRQIRDHWHRREVGTVLQMCGESKTAIARVLKAGLLRFDDGLARMEDAVEIAGDHEATLLRRNLPLLATLANIATMLGLLGTVLGMIESFDLIAKTGTGDARVVAGGIFQALVTTAAGLMVGIFAIFMHMVFRRRVDVLVLELQEKSFRLLEDLQLQDVAAASERREAEPDMAPQEA